MDFLTDWITDWLKGVLIDGIMGNLNGLFDNVNNQVGEIANQVGTSPAAWNAGVFSLIRQLSETVVLPIAGLVLTFVMCYELIQMIIDRNNLHDIDTFLFFKWVFKTFVAVLILSNTFNIVMAVFDVAQSVVNRAGGLIGGSTAVSPDMLNTLEAQLTTMDIRYDGVNINKIKKSDLRRSLGIVLQDVNLFTGTVLDNIRYGKLDATDEECIAAAKLANADGFIRMLPDEYNTVLEGDGSGLSQGQRQLISIARAAVADPPVMILDEATSSIDTRTEAIVQKGMDTLMKGRTVFVIAHRLSTVQNADVIMVLEDGRIIERGSHEQLINERGKYYQLYTGAFELE